MQPFGFSGRSRRKIRVRYRLAILVCAWALAGCRQPYHLCTDNRVTVSGPISASVTADLRPIGNQGPLAEMAVAGESARHACPKVALVDVDGLLLNANFTGPYSASENPVALLREKLDAAARDPHVCAVVLRINSPGGGVAATDMMWRELSAFRQRSGRPVVACLMDVATGGGYYLATACDVICAHPTTVAGGIGVVLNLYNLQDTMAQFNVLCQTIKAGENIDMGTATRAMTPETQQWLQAMADEYHRRFIRVVEESRGQVAPADTFDGRVLTASEAMRRGLIDRIGYLDDAVGVAQELAGKGRVQVVMFHRRNDPARTPFAVTPNTPAMNDVLPVSIPGIERTRLPTFLYLWQLNPTLQRIGGS